MDNYTLTAPSLTANITAKDLTVADALAADKVYDGTTDAVISGATMSGVISAEDVTISDATMGMFASKNVGTDVSVYTAVTIEGADHANYSVLQQEVSANITASALEITADEASKYVNEDDPALSYTISSGELFSDDALTGELSREVGETAGTYAIEQGSLSAGDNYLITFVSADFIINAASSISTEYTDADISIFPNPANGQISISSSHSIQNILILNSLGQIARDINSEFSNIDISSLKSGAYILLIKTNDGLNQSKLLKK